MIQVFDNLGFVGTDFDRKPAPDQSRLNGSLFKFKAISIRHLVDTQLHDSQTL